MYETGGLLARAMKCYLDGADLTAGEIVLIRAYLQQWIGSPVWLMNPGITDAGRKAIEVLRSNAARIANRRDIDRWLRDAIDEGIDPL